MITIFLRSVMGGIFLAVAFPSEGQGMQSFAWLLEGDWWFLSRKGGVASLPAPNLPLDGVDLSVIQETREMTRLYLKVRKQ